MRRSRQNDAALPHVELGAIPRSEPPSPRALRANPCPSTFGSTYTALGLYNDRVCHGPRAAPSASSPVTGRLGTGVREAEETPSSAQHQLILEDESFLPKSRAPASTGAFLGAGPTQSAPTNLISRFTARIPGLAQAPERGWIGGRGWLRRRDVRAGSARVFTTPGDLKSRRRSRSIRCRCRFRPSRDRTRRCSRSSCRQCGY